MTTLHRLATATTHLAHHLTHTTGGDASPLALTAALALALHELASHGR